MCQCPHTHIACWPLSLHTLLPPLPPPPIASFQHNHAQPRHSANVSSIPEIFHNKHSFLCRLLSLAESSAKACHVSLSWVRGMCLRECFWWTLSSFHSSGSQTQNNSFSLYANYLRSGTVLDCNGILTVLMDGMTNRIAVREFVFLHVHLPSPSFTRIIWENATKWLRK